MATCSTNVRPAVDKKELTKICFYCERTMVVIRERSKFVNFKIIKSLFTREELYYKFFDVDESREIDFRSAYLCRSCYSLVINLTLPVAGKRNWGGSTRKLKQLPNSGRMVTMALVKECRPPSSNMLYSDHNYSALSCPGLQSVTTDSDDIVLNRSAPGAYEVKKNCFHCGQGLGERINKNCFTFLHELVSPEDCKETFELQSDLTAVQRETFVEARLCQPCAKYVYAKILPAVEKKTVHVPVKESNVAQAVKSLQSHRYRTAFRHLIKNSNTARKVFLSVACDELRKEMKKLLKTESIFSRNIATENLAYFSLEEAGLEAKKVSPVIADVLTALLPLNPQTGNKARRIKTPLSRYATEAEAQTHIDSRMGFTLGILLNSHSPQKFNYIQSCLGVKLFQEETSQNSIGWLNEAGVTCSIVSTRRKARKLLGETPTALNPLANDNAIAGNQSEENDNSNQTPAGLGYSATADMSEWRNNRPGPSANSNPSPAMPTMTNPTSKEPNNPVPGNRHKRGRFTCNTCGKVFDFKTSLIRHRLIHSTARLHQCRVCGRAFKLRGNLLNHVCIPKKSNAWAAARSMQRADHYHGYGQQRLEGNRKRGGAPTAQFKCLFIPRQRIDQEWPCPVCDMIFREPSTQRRHVKVIHSAERPHTCHLCPRTFSSSSVLKKHLLHCGNPRRDPPWIKKSKEKKKTSKTALDQARKRRKRLALVKRVPDSPSTAVKNVSVQPSKTAHKRAEKGRTRLSLVKNVSDHPSTTVEDVSIQPSKTAPKRTKKGRIRLAQVENVSDHPSTTMEDVPIQSSKTARRQSNNKRLSSVKKLSTDLQLSRRKRRKMLDIVANQPTESQSADPNWNPVMAEETANNMPDMIIGNSHSENLYSPVDEQRSSEVELDPGIMNEQADLSCGDTRILGTAVSSVDRQGDRVSAQSLLSQLEGTGDHGHPQYAPLMTVPVGTPSSEGYFTLDASLIDFSTLEDPT